MDVPLALRKAKGVQMMSSLVQIKHASYTVETHGHHAFKTSEFCRDQCKARTRANRVDKNGVFRAFSVILPFLCVRTVSCVTSGYIHKKSWILPTITFKLNTYFLDACRAFQGACRAFQGAYRAYQAEEGACQGDHLGASAGGGLASAQQQGTGRRVSPQVLRV